VYHNRSVGVTMDGGNDLGNVTFFLVASTRKYGFVSLYDVQQVSETIGTYPQH